VLKSNHGQICVVATKCCINMDSNPGPVFSIAGFGIGVFLIPGSQWDYGIPAV